VRRAQGGEEPADAGSGWKVRESTSQIPIFGRPSLGIVRSYLRHSPAIESIGQTGAYMLSYIAIAVALTLVLVGIILFTINRVLAPPKLHD
jgi:hypothetical protein